jgi:beta-N-acetylhexosaminidase
MSLEFAVDSDPSSYGHHFIVGLDGPTLSEADKRVLAELRPAGVLLLKRNFDHSAPYEVWLGKLKELIADVKRYTEREELIISIDHEGRRVTRTPPPLTVFPNAQRFATSAASVARAQARELRTIGINLSWAPVADVHSNPANPIIGERAFANTPGEVARFACEYLEALEAEGVLGCAKHFPGHGDTSTDSHLELPLVPISEAELIARELPPFDALVKAGVSFVMTAHILYPNIDPQAPATMSKKILTGILRERLGYSKVIVSDDLDMHAVTERFTTSSLGIASAMNAGCDMFIVARNHKGGPDLSVLNGGFLAQAVKQGTITEETLFEAFSRINEVFQNRLQSHPVTKLSETLLAENQTLANQLV